jgi:hypothetical protein
MGDLYPQHVKKCGVFYTHYVIDTLYSNVSSQDQPVSRALDGSCRSHVCIV